MRQPIVSDLLWVRDHREPPLAAVVTEIHDSHRNHARLTLTIFMPNGHLVRREDIAFVPEGFKPPQWRPWCEFPKRTVKVPGSIAVTVK